MSGQQPREWPQHAEAVALMIEAIRLDFRVSEKIAKEAWKVHERRRASLQRRRSLD
jgi:hypothetical protein